MVSTEKPYKWILASGSKHRLGQLKQVGLKASAQPPEIDETPRPHEAPIDRAIRLAEAKARAIVKPDHVIIAGDQVAHGPDGLLRKPGHFDKALKQLVSMQGQTIRFESAVCVTLNSKVALECVTTQIQFRAVSEAMLSHYLTLEQPFDAAGSFYSEAMGHWLIERIESPDPTAIVGLPMLALGRCLRQLGVEPLEYVSA